MRYDSHVTPPANRLKSLQLRNRFSNIAQNLESKLSSNLRP